MRRSVGFIALSLAVACGIGDKPSGPSVAPGRQVGQPPVVSGRITAYETPGNLASEKPLDCVALAQVTSQHTPADLYPAVRTCMVADRVPEAVALSALAYAYVTFDIERVRDVSAHQAKPALQAESLGTLSPAQQAAFTRSLSATTADTAATARLCAELRRIGPPSYEPHYMIQHGLEALGGDPQEGTPAEFDAAATWAEILATRMKCP